MTVARPKVFVGSSREGQDVARAVRQQLKDLAEVTLWSDSTFKPGGNTLETLAKDLLNYDFAILAITADDTATIRSAAYPVPRDNVVFEAGLFIGALGRARTFLVYDADAAPRLPSDLSGVTRAPFTRHSGGNLVASVGEATDDIRTAIIELGPFIALDSPMAGARLPWKSLASGRCSRAHSSLAVVVHPIGTGQYWRQGAPQFSEPGVWTAALTIGTASSTNGQCDVRAFLEPAFSGPNPQSSWPTARSKTPALLVRRA